MRRKTVQWEAREARRQGTQGWARKVWYKRLQAFFCQAAQCFIHQPAVLRLWLAAAAGARRVAALWEEVWRAALLGVLLVGICQADDGGLIKRAPQELKPRRQALPCGGSGWQVAGSVGVVHGARSRAGLPQSHNAQDNTHA